jgi:hypothetical protein
VRMPAEKRSSWIWKPPGGRGRSGRCKEAQAEGPWQTLRYRQGPLRGPLPSAPHHAEPAGPRVVEDFAITDEKAVPALECRPLAGEALAGQGRAVCRPARRPGMWTTVGALDGT